MFEVLKKTIRPVSLSLMAADVDVVRRLQNCVSFYYLITPLLAFNFLTNRVDTKPNFDAFGPLTWVNFLDLNVAETALFIKLVFIVVSVAVAIQYRHSTIRFLFFLTILHVHALESSFGYINHQWYTWLYTSFFLIFIPNIWNGPKSEDVRNGLVVVWTATAFILLTYTMAGVHKFYHVFVQWHAGEIHGLARDAFLYQAAWWVPQLQQPANLLTFIASHPYIAWFFYSALHFVQLFAIWAAVRTSLLLPLTITLIAFHMGTFLTMGIGFPEHITLLCVFLLSSPFIIRNVTLKQFLYDLPIIGFCISKLFQLQAFKVAK